MRGAKSLWLVIGTLLVSAILAPVWQWYLGHFLDSITHGETGIRGAVVRGMNVISPVQQFLFGIVVGMLLAMLIGYSHVIVLWARRVRYTLTFLPQIIKMARPGVHGLGAIESTFPANESEVSIKLPSAVVVVSVGLDRKIVYLKQNSNGQLLITRASVYSADKNMEFWLDMWGRWRFKPILRLWLSLDLARYQIDKEQMWSAFEHLMWESI